MKEYKDIDIQCRNPFVNQVNSYRTVVVNGINVVFASQSLRKSGQFLLRDIYRRYM